MEKKNMKSIGLAKALLSVCAFVFLASLFVSCGEQATPKKKSGDETMSSGKLEVWIDESLYNLMDSTFKMYNKFNPDVKLTINRASSRQVMSQLLSGKARVVVVARDYLKDEDSLMKAYQVPVHKYMDIATDALVLFGYGEFPIDTINDEQVYKALTNKSYSLKSQLPKLTEEPVFVTCGTNSSEWANMNKLMLKGKKAERNIITFPTFDSVKAYVKSHKNRNWNWI